MKIADYQAGVRVADAYLASIGWEFDASSFADCASTEALDDAIRYKLNLDWPNLDQCEAFTHRLGFTFGH